MCTFPHSTLMSTIDQTFLMEHNVGGPLKIPSTKWNFQKLRVCTFSIRIQQNNSTNPKLNFFANSPLKAAQKPVKFLKFLVNPF